MLLGNHHTQNASGQIALSEVSQPFESLLAQSWTASGGASASLLAACLSGNVSHLPWHASGSWQASCQGLIGLSYSPSPVLPSLLLMAVLRTLLLLLMAMMMMVLVVMMMMAMPTVRAVEVVVVWV